MGIQMFGAVYIGTYEVSLKIFEFSGKKKIRQVDEVRMRIDLGRDAFERGIIGYELVDELCGILSEFRKVIEEYRVDFYEAYASAVLQNVSNELFVLDQIYLRTGFFVKVISNSEYRFISYKSVSGRSQFEKMIKTSAAIVDIGGASIQITLFKQGQLVTTQHMKIGTMRLQSLFSRPGIVEKLYQRQIEDYVNKELETFRALYTQEGVDTIIFVNDYGTELIKRVDKAAASESILKAEKLQNMIEKLQQKKLEEIAKDLNLANDMDPLLLPSILLFKCLIINLQAENIWIPGVDINDGIVYDFAERNRLVRATHNFNADIISAAKNLSEHYHSYSPYIEDMTKLSAKIFDTMKKIHGLEDRQKLLLEVATILHDCGKYVSLSNAATSAYHIIMSSEIIGLTHAEREIVALTVLYNSLPLEDYEEIADRIDKDSYLVVAKLSAILRVANALDQSHKKKFENIRITIKGKELLITVEAFEDISLEQTLFEAKTSCFEHVFSMRPILKAKKIYHYKK